eukprot:3034980-Pleurochrysis_carterae.AAC.1
MSSTRPPLSLPPSHLSRALECPLCGFHHPSLVAQFSRCLPVSLSHPCADRAALLAAHFPSYCPSLAALFPPL